MPQFDFSHWTSQIFWLIFSFATMYILMTVLVLPRMKNIADRREQKISGDLKRAEELHAETKSIIADAEQNLQHSQGEADAILAKATADASEMVNTRVTEAVRELDTKVSDSLKNIEKQKAIALRALDSIVTDVAVHTLNRVLTIEDAEKSVKSALNRG